MNTLLVDQDGVLADFDGGIRNILEAKYPWIRRIPQSMRTTFHPHDNYPTEVRSIITDIVNEPGFFYNLNPIPGALEAFKLLSSLPINFFICTASVLTPTCVAEKNAWVERYLGHEATKRLMICPDKTVVQARYLIDDKPQVTGCTKPTWEHLIFDQTYNLSVLGRHINWQNYAWLVQEILST